MSIKTDFRHTIAASYIGYITQAIVNNFAPLLFVTFHRTYGISLSRIGLLVTINFVTQILVDLFSAKFTDRIGYRINAVLAHVFAAVGLVLLGILPELTPDPYIGISIAVVIYAIGGGLTEVIISPIVEACPTDKKGAAMSLLHSFYCWGHVGVVLISTLFFTLFGIENWKILAVCWAVVPAANIILFAKAPIYSLHEEGGTGLTLKQLFTRKIFWVMMLMMLCAGASEQAVSQWASTFAEQGLGVSKTIGDLAGPMSFAALMGLSRLLYGKFGDKLDLDKFMRMSCLLCIAAYLCISLVPLPAVGLVGCAVCGFSVGIMWPGTFSKASAAVKGGGTALFAMLALAGDVGCSGGPTLAGFISGCFNGELRAGILAAIVFPVLLLIGIQLAKKLANNSADK